MTILAGIIDDSTYDQTTTIINSNEGENARLFVAVHGGTATGMEMFLVSKYTASAIKLTLRDSAGALLATGTLTGGSGWVPVVLDTPTPITKGESYYLGWVADQGYIKPQTDTVTWSDTYDNSSSFSSLENVWKSSGSTGKPRTALRLTGDADTLLVLDDVLVEPEPTKQFVTIVGPDLTEGSLLYGTDPSASNPDQLEADLLTSDNKNVHLRQDGTFWIENVGTNVQTFQYRIYDMDGDGWSAMATATVTPVPADSEKPVITLIGDPVVEVFLGDAYTDAGANVTDNVDADAVLVAQGSVNVTTLGSYTLTYDYTDAAGNIADTVTRTVNVVPAPIPIVESTSNPLPSEIMIVDTYDLSQHVDNPDGAPLSYSVVGGTLPAEVTLNASTGVLTKEYGAIYEAVSGITFNVVRV